MVYAQVTQLNIYQLYIYATHLSDFSAVEQVLHNEQVLFESGVRLSVAIPDPIHTENLGQRCRFLSHIATITQT